MGHITPPGRFPRCLLPAILVAVLVASAPLGARDETRVSASTDGASSAGPVSTLEQAIEQTLASAPAIRLAARQVEERRAIWLEQQGIFDDRLRFEGAYSLDRRDLIGARLQAEIDRRQLLEIAAGALELTGNQLLARLRAQNVGDRPVEIRSDCGEFEDRLVVETEDGSYILCRDISGNIRGLVLPEGTAGGLDLGELLDDDLLEGIGALIESGIATQIRSTADILLRTAEILRVQRARLGDVPEVIEQVRRDLQLVYERRLRSGLSVVPFLSTRAQEETFEGKPHDPNFGDSTVPTLFTSRAGIELRVPLGKNRGRRVVTAAERAAEAGYRAAEALYRHVLTEEVLSTVDAYWRLAAAQRRVGHLESSREMRRELLEITDLLIDSDELPPAERSRVVAQLAEARSDVADARRSWIAARRDLAEKIGIEPASLAETPVTTGKLPAGLGGELPLGEYLSSIPSQRHDLVAAQHSEEAAEILRGAAEANLRHQIDLSLDASYNVLHESFAQRAWDLGGLADAWSGEIAGPSYGFRLTWRIPLRNRAARGQLLQAESSLARNQIARTDLERTIRLQIGAVHRALSEARGELREVERTVAAQERVLGTSRTLYGEGELTLLDVLLTEEQLIAARLSRISAAERVALLEARLRFEAGRLFTADLDEGGTIRSWDLEVSEGG
ncbi:MAG: TolC family protein [Holophagales bacterium]|nr:TolC family protein [Holophagales bacterium]